MAETSSSPNPDGRQGYYYRRLYPIRCEKNKEGQIVPKVKRHDGRAFSHLWTGRFRGDKIDFPLPANTEDTDYEEDEVYSMPFPVHDTGKGFSLDRLSQGCTGDYMKESDFIQKVNSKLESQKSKEARLRAPGVKDGLLDNLPTGFDMESANRFHVFQFQKERQTMTITQDGDKDHYFLRPFATEADVYILPTESNTVKGLLSFDVPVTYKHTVIQMRNELLKEWLHDPEMKAAEERREQFYRHLSGDVDDEDGSTPTVDASRHRKGEHVTEDANRSTRKKNTDARRPRIERNTIVQLVDMLQTISADAVDWDVRDEAYDAWVELHFFGCSDWRGQVRSKVDRMLELLYLYAGETDFPECVKLYFDCLEIKEVLTNKIERFLT